MKPLLLALAALLISQNCLANAKVVGNGGDSIALSFKQTGATIVFQLRSAASKAKLGIDPDTFKEALDSALVESTAKPLYLEGKRKDAINYPTEKRILVNQWNWRQLSIQDKRMLVLHEVLGLMGIDDSSYKFTTSLEQVAAIETVPYFAGKDEDCLDADRKPKPGEIKNVHLVSIVVISDIYSATDRETYCTITAKTTNNTLERFSASFSNRCRQLFQEKIDKYRLRVVGDHVCEIL